MGGAIRAPPAADEASISEWQRSKFCERKRTKNFGNRNRKTTETYYDESYHTGAYYNPFRYRGYYYDTETGFYYLQSRYYDPATGRFINPDVFISTGQGLLGCNMFAYCRNGPVHRIDVTGLADVSNFNEDDSNPANDLGALGGGKGSSGAGTYSTATSNSPSTNNIHNGSPSSLPKNGTKVSSSTALDRAIDYLGQGYREVSPNRFVSADGARQIRIADADLLGLHGGGPHINFDRLLPTYKPVHVYFYDA